MEQALRRVDAELGRRYPLVIGGERVETGYWIRSVNPGNLDQVVGKAACGTAEHVDQAITAAERAFKRWREMPVEGRASVAFRLAAILRRNGSISRPGWSTNSTRTETKQTERWLKRST